MKNKQGVIFGSAVLLPLLFLLTAGRVPLRAQELWQRSLDSVVVRATPVVQVGVTQTRLDSAMLSTVVSASMADVLTQSSVLFIKSYGRATLSTASFRGTAPSHTQVTWNGMKMNSPMLGMVDFSLIPAYFVDGATLYHGAGSVNVTAGGLGGAVALETQAAALPEGKRVEVQYIQGISSYRTFDQYVKVRYGKGAWQGVTRVAYVHSKNDFPYTNYRKKVFETDAQGTIAGSHYPVERHTGGGYDDAHLQQEVYYTGFEGWDARATLWYTHSRRGVPMLNVDYKDPGRYTNRQQEQTLRSVVSAQKTVGGLTVKGSGGYTYTDLSYIYRADPGSGRYLEMVHSQSYVQSLYGSVQAEYAPRAQWAFVGEATFDQYFVRSQDRSVLLTDGQKRTIGYDKARAEYGAYVSAKYRPCEAVGLSLSLRAQAYGYEHTPLIPAAFAQVRLSRQGNVQARLSVARNYRYPTLNDLYFMPGGNDTLRSESGYTSDLGISFEWQRTRWGVRGDVTAYYSQIENWIVWLPTFKGFWSPVNVKQVRSYGAEWKMNAYAVLGRVGRTDFDGHFAWTRSLNYGDPVNWADRSIGKQLVYIPEFSGAFTLRHTLGTWSLAYKWKYYSQRYTTSSSERTTRWGVLPPYFMNDLSLEKNIPLRRVKLLCKFLVNNLFDEEYESVLARPMPGRNYGLFLEFTF